MPLPETKGKRPAHRRTRDLRETLSEGTRVLPFPVQTGNSPLSAKHFNKKQPGLKAPRLFFFVLCVRRESVLTGPGRATFWRFSPACRPALSRLRPCRSGPEDSRGPAEAGSVAATSKIWCSLASSQASNVGLSFTGAAGRRWRGIVGSSPPGSPKFLRTSFSGVFVSHHAGQDHELGQDEADGKSTSRPV